MNRVLDRLWISDLYSLDGTTPFSALKFSGVVDLCGATNGGARRALPPVYHLPNRDGDPWNKKQVEEAFEFIHYHIRLGRVLVACAAGMSRSASMVIGYLVRCGWSAPEAFALVKRARPEIAPVPKMLKSALAVVGSG